MLIDKEYFVKKLKDHFDAEVSMNDPYVSFGLVNLELCNLAMQNFVKKMYGVAGFIILVSFFLGMLTSIIFNQNSKITEYENELAKYHELLKTHENLLDKVDYISTITIGQNFSTGDYIQYVREKAKKIDDKKKRVNK